MDKTITYTNHYGESVTFSPSSHYHASGNDLHDRRWEYTELAGVITDMRRKTREYSLTVHMDGGGLDARNRLADVLEADSVANVDGTLAWGEWTMGCRATASGKSGWWFDDSVLHEKLTLLSSRPVWTRDVEQHFFAKGASTADASMESGYPRAYPHGYLASATGSVARNSTVGAADFRLRVFGPVASPYVIIGGNRYECDVTLSSGERVEVDTRDKTAKRIGADGTETSVYASLKTGAQDSGTYAFQRLARGDSDVVWDGTFAFDVVIHEERSEPAWS